MNDPSDGPNELGLYSELVAALLQALVSKGVKRQTLCSTTFYEQLPHLAKDLDDFEDMFVDCLTWLRDEGYVRLDGFSDGTEGESCADLIAPTALCLAAIDQKMDALEGRTGRQVLQANTAGEVSASNYVKAGSFLGGLFGGAAKSLGS